MNSHSGIRVELLVALRDQGARPGDVFETGSLGTDLGDVHRVTDTAELLREWRYFLHKPAAERFLNKWRERGRICVAVIHEDGAYLLAVEPSLVWEGV